MDAAAFATWLGEIGLLDRGQRAEAFRKLAPAEADDPVGPSSHPVGATAPSCEAAVAPSLPVAEADNAAPEEDFRGEETAAKQAEEAPAETVQRDAFAVIEALNAENSKLKDQVLRILAEMQNLGRRTEREVSNAKTYGVASFARDMLTVVDNLARALEHLPAEAHAVADPQIQPVIEGVELTARDLEAALGRHGVKRLDPGGQKFDPNFHQAIFEIPDEALPAGTVSQVVQSGWTIGDRVLRPAMVGVSKGGPKKAPKK
jgi:molecular chaperone GrpE